MNYIFLFILCFVPYILLAQQKDSITSEDYEQGVILFKSGRYLEAKESFTKAIKVNPNDVDAYFNRGIINFKQDSLNNACMDWNYASQACDSDAINLINTHCDSTYQIVKVMPQFPGGEEKLFLFLMKNIKYPKEAYNNNKSGRVYVQFIVKSTGEVTNTKILRGQGFGMDEEAIRVVKLMPKWIPGKQCGKPVNVRYNLPISYNLK